MTSASAPPWWWRSSRRPRCRTAEDRADLDRAAARSARGDGPIDGGARIACFLDWIAGSCRMALMSGPTWGFLTNHFYVLRCIAQEPSLTLREVAERIGITGRAGDEQLLGVAIREALGELARRLGIARGLRDRKCRRPDEGADALLVRIHEEHVGGAGGCLGRLVARDHSDDGTAAHDRLSDLIIVGVELRLVRLELLEPGIHPLRAPGGIERGEVRQRHAAGRRRDRNPSLQPRLGERGEPHRCAVIAELVGSDE